MLKVRINRYMLRHQGKIYCQGDTVEMEDELAIEVTKRSHGDFSIVPPYEAAAENKSDGGNNDNAENNGSAGDEDETGSGADVSAALAAADMKPAAKRKSAAKAKK